MDRRDRIRRYGLWPTLWRRLRQLQRPVTGFQRFHCLVLPLAGARPAGEGGYTVRRLGMDELEPLVDLPDAGITAKGFLAAREQRHLCVGVLDGARLASFSFNATGGARFNDRYQFVVPEGWMYHYTAATLPEWRGKRLHALQLPFLLEQVRRSQGKGIVTLVEDINYASLRSFKRMGFEAHCVFTFLGPATLQRLIAGRSGERFGFVSA